MARAYGKTVGEYFGAKKSPLIVRSSALDSHVAATYLKSDVGTGMTDSIPAEAALLIAVQLRPLFQHQLWLDGRKQVSPPYAAGAVTMVDLQSRPVANLMGAYECVQMYFPQSALDNLSEIEEIPFLRNVPLLLGASDRMLEALGRLASFAVNPIGAGSAILLETMLAGVCRHVSSHYGGAKIGPSSPRKVSILSAPQERQIKEYIDAYLDTNISLITLANLCTMRPSNFLRAFKNTFGTSPQQWITDQRLRRARHSLVFGDESLAAVAVSCGFHDQSHFSRVFRSTEGIPPGAWKLQNRP